MGKKMVKILSILQITLIEVFTTDQVNINLRFSYS